MAALYSHTTRASGLTLTANIYNSDHQNHIDNGVPLQQDDYSSNVAQMKVATDPGEVGSESLATTQAGELERLRFAIRELKGTDQWYESIVAMQGSTTGLTIGSNSVNPDGTLHVHTASAGSVVAPSNADDLVVENSGDTGISILSPDASTSSLSFGAPGDNQGAFLQWSDTGTVLRIATDIASGFISFRTASNNEVAILDANGALLIGDTTNAKMTVGLTINQGANDDEIFALKSSDVGHAMTTIAEADTFATMKKEDPVAGGLLLTGLRDSGSFAGDALKIVGVLGEAASTTDTTTDIGVVNIVGQITDGGTGVTVLADAGNLITFRNNATTRLLMKGDGTLHATNITAGSGDLDGVALDAEDDIGLVRMHERTLHKGLGIAMSKWDEQIKVNEDDLKRLGVLSSQGDFYNMQRMNSLLGGAIWQLHTRLMETQERLAATERKLVTL